MVTVIRKPFILILVMLQFIAPLVHGHIGEKSYTQGLHVPGLESYIFNQDTQVLLNVNQDWDSDGVLVVIDAGIKNLQANPVDNADSSFAFLPSGQCPVIPLPEKDCNFSPQKQAYSFKRLCLSPSPRAPPAHQL